MASLIVKGDGNRTCAQEDSETIKYAQMTTELKVSADRKGNLDWWGV